MGSEIALTNPEVNMADNMDDVFVVEVSAEERELNSESQREALEDNGTAMGEEVPFEAGKKRESRPAAVTRSSTNVVSLSQIHKDVSLPMNDPASNKSHNEGVEVDSTRFSGLRATAEDAQAPDVKTPAEAIQAVGLQAESIHLQDANEEETSDQQVEELALTNEIDSCQHKFVETTVDLSSSTKGVNEEISVRGNDSALVNSIANQADVVHEEMIQDVYQLQHQDRLELAQDVIAEDVDMSGMKREYDEIEGTQVTSQLLEGQHEGQEMSDENAHKKQKTDDIVLVVGTERQLKQGDDTLEKSTDCMVPRVLPDKELLVEESSESLNNVLVVKGTDSKISGWECTEAERYPEPWSLEWLLQGASFERSELVQIEAVNILNSQVEQINSHERENELETVEFIKINEQVESNQSQERLLWPPTVIVENTRTGKSEDGRWTGIGNIEMACFLRDINHTAGKPKSCWGKEGHKGRVLVQYQPTLLGLQEAERLHKHFATNRRSRKEWASLRPFWHGLPGIGDLEEGPDFLRIDEFTQLKKRVFYGYLARAEDVDKIFPPRNKKLRRKVCTLSRLQINEHKEPDQTIHA